MSLPILCRCAHTPRPELVIADMRATLAELVRCFGDCSWVWPEDREAIERARVTQQMAATLPVDT